MTNKAEEILSLVADMEACIPCGDDLTDAISVYSDGELFEDDLRFVAAAGSSVNYEAFRKRFQLD